VTGPTAHTPLGDVRGTERDGIATFRGVPYARADRFARPSVALDPVPGGVDATAWGPQALQVPGVMERMLGQSSQPTAEDCLTLNVFTPGLSGSRPVMVWVHGGAFTNGAGSVPWYEGSRLARRGDVVVVTINYRLGVFGFRGNDNLGIHDQLAALEWVQRHIAHFGGDPAQVTVFGESAGGASVVALMATERSRSLFARAVAMSPSIPQLRTASRAEEALAEFLDAARADHPDDLSHLSAEALLAAQASVLGGGGDALTAFSPAVDGDLFPSAIADLAARDPRPLLLGTNRDEMHLWTAFDPALTALDDAGALGLYERALGDLAGDGLDLYRRHRPDHRPGQLVSALRTDAVFRVPARRLAEARLAAGAMTHLYWFTFPTPAFGGVLGACHALDIPFALDNLDRKGVEMFTGDSPDRTRLADRFSGALVDWAHGRSPGWDPYDHDRLVQVLDTDAVIGDDVLADPEADLRRLWDTAHAG
jgi:para-nitrobenzyl esterase